MRGKFDLQCKVPDVGRDRNTRDKLACAPVVELYRSETAAGFGFNILDKHRNWRNMGIVPCRLGPFPATLDHRETHFGPLATCSLPFWRCQCSSDCHDPLTEPVTTSLGKLLGHANVAGMTILYVMAVQAEYGPYLRARITPLITGVGPVEAAIGVTRALADRSTSLPRLVVSLGSAGSRTLEQCGIYQASSVGYRDMDASALGFPQGQTPFLDLPPVLPLTTIEGIRSATLSTGANVVSGRAYDGIAADMVDMETYAVLRACQAYDVPLLALRGISDGAAELSHIDDWTQYLHVIDQKLAAAVELIETALAENRL